MLGADRAEIVAALKEHASQASVFVTDKTEPFEAMEEIVTEAFSISEPGDTVLLAPAAASLDMFKGMGQRGDLFAHNIIGTIKGLTEEKG